jgi:hypothetical protein
MVDVLTVYLWLIVQCGSMGCDDGNTHYRALWNGDKGVISYSSHNECAHTGEILQELDPKVDGYVCMAQPTKGNRNGIL